MAFGYYGGWPAYVPVAERRRKALLEIARMKKAGQPAAPVVIEGRKIAASFWGKAWCDNLERYQDYANRLPRGRSYVRNGSVIDLRIGPREVRAKVIGSQIYSILIAIKPLPAAAWTSICADCAGRVDSLVELLQGRLSKSVMARVCRPADGLFPKAADIKFSCSCPDGAAMCKHVAAALYGAGARLDAEPELLFRLRAVDVGEIFANLDAALPASRSSGSATRLDAGDLSDIFDIELAASAPSAKTKTKTKAKTKAATSAPAKPPPVATISSSKASGAKPAKLTEPTKPAKARESRTAAAQPVRPPRKAKTTAATSAPAKPSPPVKFSPSKTGGAKPAKPTQSTKPAKSQETRAGAAVLEPVLTPRKKSGAAAPRSGAVGVRRRNAAAKRR